jgi:hypothetical protein
VTRAGPGSRWWIAGGLLLGACVLAVRPLSGEGFSWQRGQTDVALLNAGRVVWRLQYSKNLQKPMFHPLALLDGTVLTWDGPPDHPWHHAHWFCWKYINGVNYWEEDRETGRSEGRTRWGQVEVQTAQDFSAVVAMSLEYGPPERPPVLVEQRRVEISAPAADGSYHLDWTMKFTAGREAVTLNRTPLAGEPEGKPWGGYAGLSVRFAKDFAEWQVHSTKGPTTWDAETPMRAVFGAEGLDFSGRVSQRDAGIAILDHPQNLNAPTPWYIATNPKQSFGFAQAALLFQGPHQLAAGESFTLRYRVLVHEGRWGAARIQEAQSKFARKEPRTND